YQVDRILIVADAAALKACGTVEAQAGNGLPGAFDFTAPDFRIEILVDGGAGYDLRDLIVLVIVEEEAAVQRDGAVAQRVLAADFISIDEFGTEGQVVRQNLEIAA